MRIGQGYDAHKIKEGKGLILGGINIECGYSIEAHSDGDIIIHALIDSLLGAAAYGDLGTYFPSEDKSLKDISSVSMLEEVLKKLSKDSFSIINIDITYVGKIPKIISYREAIIENLSKILAIDSNKISCKATTTDGLGFEGNLEGVSCHCISLIE